MGVKVTITVEIESGDALRPRTQTFTASDNMPTQAVPRWAASAVEQSIVQTGADIVRQIAAVHGDMRDVAPDAPGFRGSQRERPLTGVPAEA